VLSAVRSVLLQVKIHILMLFVVAWNESKRGSKKVIEISDIR